MDDLTNYERFQQQEDFEDEGKVIYNNVLPAVPFYILVKRYAEARSLPFFTWNQMQIARELYWNFAELNN
jgi:hypothetical protein